MRDADFRRRSTHRHSSGSVGQHHNNLLPGQMFHERILGHANSFVNKYA